MTYTYSKDAERLLTEFVSRDHFGGFLTWDSHTREEQLFAVDQDSRRALTRTDRIGCKEFDGDGWTLCDTVPDHAEWIGNYSAPKARATLIAHSDAERSA